MFRSYRPDDYTDVMSSTFFVGRTPRAMGGLLALSAHLLFGTRTLFRIAFVVMLPLYLLNTIGAGLLLQLLRIRDSAPDFIVLLLSMAAAVCNLCAALIALFAQPWMEGALAHHVVEGALGYAVRGVRGSYSVVQRAWPALFTSGLLRQIAAVLMLSMPLILVRLVQTVIGVESQRIEEYSTAPIIALVVFGPIALVLGIFLVRTVLGWSMRAPVAAVEGAGILGTLRRSTVLVQGGRLRMFGRLLPFMLLNVLFSLLPGWCISSWAETPDSAMMFGFVGAIGLLVGAVAMFFVIPLEAVYLTLNYLDQRVRGEDLFSQLAAGDDVGVVEAPAAELLMEPIMSAPVTPAQHVIALQQRLRHEGKSCTLWLDLAGAYGEIGDLGAALDALERARAAEPADPGVLLAIAGVQRARRDLPAARIALQEYLALQPGPEAVNVLHRDSRFSALLDDGGRS